MLPSPKAIHHPSEALPLPPLRAVGLNIKTVPDVATGKSYEVVAASLLHCTIAPDVPLDLAKWRTCAGLRRVSILRRSAGSTWPTQLQELAKAGSPAHRRPPALWRARSCQQRNLERSHVVLHAELSLLAASVAPCGRALLKAMGSAA